MPGEFLSSGKVIKLSSANNEVTKQDLLSKLPDTLLTHILSLLPDADACRTSVLSKTWMDLWMFLPNLHFVIPNSSTREQASEYYDFVDDILAIRDGLPIRRLFIYWSQDVYNLPRVEDWLRIAVQRKVQLLVLRSPSDGSWVSFCLDLFRTCETLLELTLEGQFDLEVPTDKVFFPCLKKISLVSIQYGVDDKSFENLITSCCPVLEELFLERLEVDYMRTIKISSISLKRLRIYNTVDVYNEFVIDAPKLEYLYIEDKMEHGCDYSFTKKPPSLVEAYIDTKSDTLFQVFPKISAVNVLTLTSPTIRAFHEANEIINPDEDYGWDVPTFPNLVKLVIDLHDIPIWRLLYIFLDNMPNLEHITFLNGLLPSQNARRIDHEYWNPQLEVPACLRFKLKEIIILNQEAIAQEELTLIWYMLNNSDNLEILTVNGHELDPMRLEVLLKFHRGSNLCRFEIV